MVQAESEGATKKQNLNKLHNKNIDKDKKMDQYENFFKTKRFSNGTIK